LEFAQQLQKDVKQRVKEIEELKTNIEVKNKIVKDLQQDNMEKVLVIKAQNGIIFYMSCRNKSVNN